MATWNKRKKIFCKNCGKEGHVHKMCTEPITSFGIIAYRINNKTPRLQSGKLRTTNDILCTLHSNLSPLNQNNSEYEFFMIQRKNSMGFFDFIRGEYETEDQINMLFSEMTCHERHLLLTLDFEEIWDIVWFTTSRICINSFQESLRKFRKVNVKSLLDKTQCNWSETEFGFPKGRKNMNESDLCTAIREFREESGFSLHNFNVLQQYGTFEELFYGTNGIKYRHVYYIASISLEYSLPVFDKTNIHQVGEISNFGWFSFEDAKAAIRSYDTEKKLVLEKVVKVICV